MDGKSPLITSAEITTYPSWHSVPTWIDWFSITGSSLTFIALVIAIVQLRKTASAALAAKQASEDIKIKLISIEILNDLSKSITFLSELKVLTREKKWELVSDRCGFIKLSIINIKNTYPNLEDNDKKKLQSSITQLTTLEKKIEENISVINSDTSQLNKANNILIKMTVDLQDLLSRLKTEYFEEKH